MALALGPDWFKRLQEVRVSGSQVSFRDGAWPQAKTILVAKGISSNRKLLVTSALLLVARTLVTLILYLLEGKWKMEPAWTSHTSFRKLVYLLPDGFGGHHGPMSFQKS